MTRFEGYYVKACDGVNSVAVIFGCNKGKGSTSFIQVVTKDGSFNIDFEYAKYSASEKPFCVTVGENFACEKEMVLSTKEISGRLRFGKFCPLKYDIMGYFKYFPFMECKHKVVSMHHTVSGQLAIGGRTYNFENAHGYIEGDCGHSFPQKYFWTQCGNFPTGQYLPVSVMASAARIPYLGLRFLGTTCVVQIGQKQYRLATYLGARIKTFGLAALVITQGRKLLKITAAEPHTAAHPLAAPAKGKMNRIIKENIAATVNYKFSIGKKVIFDITSDRAAFEYSENN